MTTKRNPAPFACPPLTGKEYQKESTKRRIYAKLIIELNLDHMENYLLPITVIIFSAIIIKFLDNRKKSVELNNAYYKKEFLLTIPEREFFETLQKLLPANYICFPQMVLANILSVKAKGKDFKKYRNKISKKTIDFVIFEKEYLRPVLAIEYDDKSHNKSSRRKRDGFVNESLKQANLDIVHIKYNQNNLEEAINTEIIKKL